MKVENLPGTAGSNSPNNLAPQRPGTADGEAMLITEWADTLFLQYFVEPSEVQRQLPPGFELELYDGQACVSLVAVTMKRFRPVLAWSPASLLRLIPSQRFLNFRTYVRKGEETGAFFFWGWLSAPFGLGPPLGALGLSASLATIDYRQDREALSGEVIGKHGLRFQYEGSIESTPGLAFCPVGSLAESALERYTGFFCQGQQARKFRVGHPAWLQSKVRMGRVERGLVVARFPWFEKARFVEANLGQGFNRVLISRPQRTRQPNRNSHRLTAFYKMP